MEASKKNWQAAAWLLERCFPRGFALFTLQRHQISGEVHHEHKVQMVNEAELIEMHRAAAEVALEAPRFNTLKGQN
jgi:hypothetical protein